MTPAATLLRQARQKAGLTQTQLAERLGKAQASVAALERAGANPTLATLDEAMRATGHRLELSLVPDGGGADDTLIAANLRKTPAERLASFEVAHAEVQELRDLMRRPARRRSG